MKSQSDYLARKKVITILGNNLTINPNIESGFYTVCKSNSLDATLDSCILSLLCPKIQLRPDFTKLTVKSNKCNSTSTYSNPNTTICGCNRYVKLIGF